MTDKTTPEWKPLCDYLECMAGMGVAGSGLCFLNGEPLNEKCPEFIRESEAILIQCIELLSLKAIHGDEFEKSTKEVLEFVKDQAKFAVDEKLYKPLLEIIDKESK